jgi:HlyD family secretion protein
LAAKVTRVEPAGFTKVSALGIEEQRVRTILQLQNVPESHGKLGHEYRVFARIGIYEATNVLRVPTSALFRRRDQWALYIIESGRARFVPVELAQRNAAFAEIAKGVSEGGLVVLHPSDRVSDGVRVAPLSTTR